MRSDSDIRQKFAALRTTFLRNCKTVRESCKSGAGTEQIYVPSFNHYQKLMFLKETTEVDLSTSFTDIEEDRYTSFFDAGKENSMKTPVVPSPRNPQAKKRKLQLEDNQNLTNDALNAVITTLNSIQSQPTISMDECDAQGVVYAAKLRSLVGQDRWDLIDEVNACFSKHRSQS